MELDRSGLVENTGIRQTGIFGRMFCVVLDYSNSKQKGNRKPHHKVTRLIKFSLILG